MNRNKTFGFNLYYIFISSIIIPILLFAFLFSLYYHSLFSKQQERETINLFTSTENTINQVFNIMISSSEACYISSDAFKLLPIFINPSLQIDQLRLNQIEKNYEEIIYKNMFKKNLDIEAISFFPFDNTNNLGSLIVSRVTEGIQQNSTYQYWKEDWFKQLKGERTSIKLFHKNLPEYLKNNYLKDFSTISVATKVFNLNTGKPLGIMKVDIRKSKLESKIKNLSLSDNSYIYISDNNHNIISKTSSIPNINENIFDHNIKNKYFIKSKVLEDSPFTIYYIFRKKDSITTIIIASIFLVLILVIEISISFFIYKKKTKEMVNNFRELCDTMEKISKGNLKARAKGSRDEYFDKIVDSLNQMAEKLEKTIQKEYIAVIEKKEAQYKALQSQINPHFFYNTLNGFIALNRMGEVEKLEQSIISLTRLFRYTCNNSTLSTVNEEAIFLQEYLNLQKLKYEDRLSFEIKITEKSKSIQIPKLILQPIVENSILHGLEKISKPVKITISTTIYKALFGKVLLITIEDNGMGCTKRELQKNQNIAINNIKNRLEIFTPESIFTYDCQIGKGVKTFITIPLEENNYDNINCR